MNVGVATEGCCPVGSNILSYGAPVNVLPTSPTIVGSSISPWPVPAPTSTISSLSSTSRDESLASFGSSTPNPTSFLTPSQSSVIVTSPTTSFPFSSISQPQSSFPSSLLHIQSQFSSTHAPTALVPESSVTPFTSLQSSPSVYPQSSFSSISSLSSSSSILFLFWNASYNALVQENNIKSAHSTVTKLKWYEAYSIWKAINLCLLILLLSIKRFT